MASKLVEANHPNACPLPWLPCAGAPDLHNSLPLPFLSDRHLRARRPRRRRSRHLRPPRRAAAEPATALATSVATATAVAEPVAATAEPAAAIAPPSRHLLLLPCYHFINYPSSELTASLKPAAERERRVITKTKGGRHCRVQGDGSYRQVLIGDITGHKQKIVVVILSTFGSENHERGTKV
jgi:hypothetical protein